VRTDDQGRALSNGAGDGRVGHSLAFPARSLQGVRGHARAVGGILLVRRMYEPEVIGAALAKAAGLVRAGSRCTRGPCVCTKNSPSVSVRRTRRCNARPHEPDRFPPTPSGVYEDHIALHKSSTGLETDRQGSQAPQEP
jgi:hypothetical protein